MTADVEGYNATQEKPLQRYKYFARMMEELKKILDEEIKPLLMIA